MRGRTIAAIAATAALALATPAFGQGDPIMPLSQVRSGMECTGFSVFRGAAVEPFGVEVLDVVGGATTGGSAARMLVRVHGERVDATGVGPGFSGSPIYCPGPDGVAANAGAISETIGDYGGRTVLATPIEQILGTPVAPPTGPVTPAKARRDRAVLARARPLASPLTVRGLGPGLMRSLESAARRRGVALLQAPPALLPAGPLPPLRPGSAMSAGLSSGDIAIGAVGTVAYVDGASVWSFGHAFDGAGARALLLQDAYVAAIVNNPVQLPDTGGTYKLAGAVNDVGTVTSDGFHGVAGRTGAPPPLTQVRVYADDEDTRRKSELQVRVVDETDVGNPTGFTALSFVAPLTVSQGATDVLGATPLRVAGHMCLQVVVRERKAPLRFCNRYVSDGTTGSFDGAVGNLVALSAGSDAAEALALIDAYKPAGLHVTEVSARIGMTRGQRQAYMRSVSLPSRVRRGQTVNVRMGVRLVRGEKRMIRFRWRVPRSLRPGFRTLTFRGTDPDGGGGFFDTIMISLDESEEPDAEGPRSLERLARTFASVHRYDGIRLRGKPVYRDATFRIGGRVSADVFVRRR